MIIKICSELEINKNIFEKFGYNLGCKRKKENHCDSLFLWSWRNFFLKFLKMQINSQIPYIKEI